MLRICLECDLGGASCASDVEAENGDGEILFVCSLLACVELSAFVDEFAAGSAFHAERCHETDGLDSWAGFLWAAFAFKFGRIKVRGVVFGEDLPFRHVGGCLVVCDWL